MVRGRQRGSELGLLLLASQIYQVGIDHIPPVTLATLGLNVYLFLFPAAPLMAACISLQEAYYHQDWRRLLLSPLHHGDDWHLYFNMTSLLWKGIKLERKLGGPWFAYLLSVFSLLTGLVYLLLEAGLMELTDDWSYGRQCAVGFSGVLFGLKVVNNHIHPGGTTNVMGIPVANRHACWVELVIIHILNPGTSFVGHLAGILVGLLYTKGPLKNIMTICAGMVESGLYLRPATYYNSSGASGRRNPNPANDSTRPPNASGYRASYPSRNNTYPSNRPSYSNTYSYSHTNPPNGNTGAGGPSAPSNPTAPSDPNAPSAPTAPSAPSAPPYEQHPYTAGLSEAEQYQEAIRASFSSSPVGSTQSQSRPEDGLHIPPEPTLDLDEIRRRRLQRFAKESAKGSAKLPRRTKK